MKTTVHSIKAVERPGEPVCSKLLAEVHFSGNPGEFTNFAHVYVYIDNTNATLSEIRAQAISEAIKFLKSVL